DRPLLRAPTRVLALSEGWGSQELRRSRSEASRVHGEAFATTEGPATTAGPFRSIADESAHAASNFRRDRALPAGARDVSGGVALQALTTETARCDNGNKGIKHGGHPEPRSGQGQGRSRAPARARSRSFHHRDAG